MYKDQEGTLKYLTVKIRLSIQTAYYTFLLKHISTYLLTYKSSISQITVPYSHRQLICTKTLKKRTNFIKYNFSLS